MAILPRWPHRTATRRRTPQEGDKGLLHSQHPPVNIYPDTNMDTLLTPACAPSLAHEGSCTDSSLHARVVETERLPGHTYHTPLSSCTHCSPQRMTRHSNTTHTHLGALGTSPGQFLQDGHARHCHAT